MNAVILPITPNLPVPVQTQETTAWDRATAKQRTKALAREQLVQQVLIMRTDGVAIVLGCKLLAVELIDGATSALLLEAAREAGGKKKTPSAGSIKRWVYDYQRDGLNELLPQSKGSTRKELGCEVRAMQLFSQGSRPNAGDVTRRLQQEGHDVEYHQILRFWKSLPANQQENSRARIGPIQYLNTQGYYTRRNTDGVPVGSCYQSDGNMLPIYLQHPTGDRPSRWELTPVIDVTSRYIPGYWLEENESANGTIHALTDAMLKEGHAPTDFQADNGPGFKNKRVKRFFIKLGITESHPRAQNPKANGYIERWHKIMCDELLKFLPGYCGKDASPELKKAFLKKVDEGEVKLLTVEQFKDELDKYIHWYNHGREHGSLGKCTPASLWKNIDRCPPHDLGDLVYWEVATRTVRRGSVSLPGREYLNAELFQYNGRKVLVEYNLRNDSAVKILDMDERWICDAPIINRSPYRSKSHLQDAEKKKLVQKLKRIDLKREETERRAGLAITHDTVLDDIETMTSDGRTGVEVKTGMELVDVVNTPSPQPTGLDILDTDY